MKLPNFATRSMLARVLALSASTVMLTGCIESGKFAWAPDGSQAAVCANDGLRFSNASGTLSATQLKTPDEVAWYPDGKRLLVVTHADGLTWDELAPLLPAARKSLVEQQGLLFVKSAQQPGVTPTQFGKALHDKISRDALNEILLFLKSKHDSALKDAFGKDWTDYTVNSAALYTLASYRWDAAANKLTDEKIIWRSTKSLNSPRVAPNSETLTVVHDGRNLFLLSDGAQPRLLVEGVSRYPDWSRDGKCVYFFLESSEDKAPDKVARLEVSKLPAPDVSAGSATAGGADPLSALPATSLEKVAELPYYKDARVRCVADGSILLATAIATNKSRPDVFGRKTIFVETLYRLAPGAKKPTQIGLSNDFVNKCGYCSFEPSPAAAKVALATENGSVRIVPLPSGSAKEISKDNNNPTPFAPCWRTEDELCFATTISGSETREVVLYNIKTNTKTSLSSNWPKTAIAGILIKEEAQQNRFEEFLNAIYQ